MLPIPNKFIRHVHTSGISIGICFLSLITNLSATTLDFTSSNDLSLLEIESQNSNLTWDISAGIGDPPGGGSIFEGTGVDGDEQALAASLKESFPASAISLGTFSVLLSPRELNDITTGKDRGEIRLGLIGSKNIDSSKVKDFMHKTNPSLHVKFKAEHGDGKDRKLEAELVSFDGVGEQKGGKQDIDSVSAFDHWIKIIFTITRSGPDSFALSYRVEDHGPDGDSFVAVILEYSDLIVSNNSIANNDTLFGAFVLSNEKGSDKNLFLDNFTSLILTEAPEAPLALPADPIGGDALTANWQPAASGADATAFIVELSLASNNFAANTFIAADGTTGQPAGVSVGADLTSLVFQGLQPDTSYIYRLRGTNSAGTGGESNVIPVTTLAANANSPPTLDPIVGPGPLWPDADPQVIQLTGISPGVEADQTVTITAVSNQPSIVPNPVVDYTSPNTTGSLTFAPTGSVEGDVVITVTVDDGQDVDNEAQQSFVVRVKTPTETLSFDSDTDLGDLAITTVDSTLTFQDGAGIGTTPSGALIFQGAGVDGEQAMVVWRAQAYDATVATTLEASLFINFREIDDLTGGTDKDKGELRLGFVGDTVLNIGKPQEFLEKNNSSIGVKITAEHKPDKERRKLEAESFSADLQLPLTIKGPKLAELESTHFDNWLKITVRSIRISEDRYSIGYVVEDWGTDGQSFIATVWESDFVEAQNPAIANDTDVYAAFVLKNEKQSTSRIYLDEFSSVAAKQPPGQPLANAADLVTSTSFRANWTPDQLSYATGFILQIADSPDFNPGTFFDANGNPNQSTGIELSDGSITSFVISNLTPSTLYYYQIISINIHGESLFSGAQSVTTLADGQNSPPTLDPIADPAPIGINSGSQVIQLSGITTGGELNQTATVTATSDNPELIPTPVVTHTHPSPNANLTFTPAFASSGTAVITVTVDDGSLSANAVISQSFTITVLNPDPLNTFDDQAALDILNITSLNADIFWNGVGGIGDPPGGGVNFVGTDLGLDRVGVLIRPESNDANVASAYFISLLVNASEIVGITSGKDKGEVELGFNASKEVDPFKPQDWFKKGAPSLSMKFKVEHEPGKADKERKLELELLSFDGDDDTKSGKPKITGVPETSNWLNVQLFAVRASSSQYFMWAEVIDRGADGTTQGDTLLSVGPFLVNNPSFATSPRIYSGLILSTEKNGSSTLAIDDFEVLVDTTTPDAPLSLEPTNLSSNGFQINWNPAEIGFVPEGFIVELSSWRDLFDDNTFLAHDGTPGQPSGFFVGGSTTASISITGLLPGELYFYRVRSTADGNTSAFLNTMSAQTLPPDYDDWLQLKFTVAEQNDASISGQTVDVDGDNFSNLLEFAFGTEPKLASSRPSFALETTNGFLEIEYQRRSNSTQLIYTPLVSSDLVEWREDTFEVSISDPDVFGMETVVVRDIAPITDHSRRFMKLDVTLSPF